MYLKRWVDDKTVQIVFNRIKHNIQLKANTAGVRLSSTIFSAIAAFFIKKSPNY